MYREKYLKYKTKYLSLSRQSGGAKKHEEEGGADGNPLPLPPSLQSDPHLKENLQTVFARNQFRSGNFSY